jgi:cytochrome c-type biogenesis protein CcmH/NrfF
MTADDGLLWVLAVANLVVALGITVWMRRRQRGRAQLKLGASVLVGLSRSQG